MDIHIGSIERRITGNTCPVCGKPNDGGTSIDDQAAVLMPKPGDFAVCICCGALNVYGDGLRLRLPTPAERRHIARDPRLSKLIQLGTDFVARRRRNIQ